MAANEVQYTKLPRIGIGQVDTAQTNRDPGATGTNIVDVLTGATGGTRVWEVVIKAADNPADSIVFLFIYEGTNYRLFDEFDLGDPAAGSATVESYRTSRLYSNLILPSSTYKLCASISATTTAGKVNVIALGADYSA